MRSIVVILGILFLAFQPSWAGPGDIQVRASGDTTRIIIETDRPVTAQVFQGLTNEARTITVGLSEAQIFAQTASIMQNSGIESIQSGGNRVVFSLNRPLHIQQIKEVPPIGDATAHRVIIDLTAVSEVRFDRRADRQEKRLASFLAEPIPEYVLPTRTPTTSDVQLALGTDSRKTIVIDAGHGGRDPGTTVSPLIQEKEVVLETALLLRDRLARNPDYDVRLVRDDDTYVDHEDRVSMARNWGADLFISLHADSVSRSDVQGAAVFTLDQKGQRRILNTSKKNDWHIDLETAVPVDAAVGGILDRLTIRETLSNSQRFAQILIPELKRSGPVHASGHRKSNLFVLLAPDMPAVLVELGFLSNESDAERLASERGREKAARSIERAIDRYFSEPSGQFVEN